MIVDLYTDLLNACVPILFFMQDKSREEKQEIFQKTIQPKQIPFFEFMENQIKSLGGYFIAGG